MSHGLCSLESCSRPAYCKSFCRSHYDRLYRYGDPEWTPTKKDPAVRFEENTQRQGNCLIWTGGLSAGRYGSMLVNGKKMKVHRWVWEQNHGPIPPRIEIDHRCRNTACCEISHLRATTHKQNVEHTTPYKDTPSGYRGVTRAATRSSRWQASVKHNKEDIYLGLYGTPEEAALAAVTKRLEVFTHNDLDQELFERLSA